MAIAVVCLKDLIDFAESQKKNPDDPYTAFVFDFSFSSIPVPDLRIFLTTKRLLEFSF